MAFDGTLGVLGWPRRAREGSEDGTPYSKIVTCALIAGMHFCEIGLWEETGNLYYANHE